MMYERFRETKIGQRAIAIALALLLAVGTSPGLALAADTAPMGDAELTMNEPPSEKLYNIATSGASGNVIDLAEASPSASGEGWTFSGGKYTILDGADVIVTGQTTQREAYVDAGASAHVTLQDATIDSNRALFVASPASLRLTLVGTNTLKSSWGQIAGISVRSGASLTIDGTGSLMAHGSAFAAGIGGDSLFGCGDITISGGTIHATGGSQSSGIGASTGKTNTGTITINGGTVYAARDPEATLRQDINASSVTINGGSVSLASKSISPQPKDSGSANVYLNTLTVGDPAMPGAAATAGTVGGVACDASAPGSGHPSAGSYGIYSVATDGVGNVSFWLPQTTAAQEVSLVLAGDDTPYRNSFARAATNDNASVLRQPVPRTPVAFTAAQSGGASGVANSTAISLTFSEAVTGLAASDITVSGGTGTAAKGALSGSGASWTLALTGVAAEGTVRLSIGDFGAYTVTNGPQSVTVYKDMRTWTASVNQTGAYTFPDASIGYDNTALGHVFTITNTGNQPLTGVSAGFDAGSLLPFEFAAPLASTAIPVGGSAAFALRPKAGLSSGGWSRTHTDILRIRWVNDASGKGLYFVVRFTVNEKAAPTTGSLSFALPPGLVYTGLPQGIGAVSAASGVSGLGDVSVWYEGVGATVYAKSATPPTDAGTYAVAADIAEGASYTAANGIPLGEYSIAKAPQDAPPPPVLAYKTSWSIAFVAHDGYEYCVGYSPTGWMSSWTGYFEIGNLSEGYAHECYQRLAGDANHEPSPASEALIVVVGTDNTPPVVYAVTDHFGAWTGSGTASARVDADYAKFVNLAYNGMEVSVEHYTVKQGSTVITLAEAYLKTLAAGTHTYVAHFSDGHSGNITLVVARQATGNADGNTDKANTDAAGKTAADANGNGTSAGSNRTAPRTGDNSGMAPWAVALLASALGLSCLVPIAQKRRQDQNGRQ